MRIISKFHDYYDSIMVHGQDKSVIYNRDKFIFDTSRKDTPTVINDLFNVFTRQDNSWRANRMPKDVSNKKFDFSFSFMQVVFCGTLYPAVVVKKMLRGGIGNEVNFFYNTSSIVEYFKQHGISLQDRDSTHDSKTKIMILEDRFKHYDLPSDDLDWLIVNKISVAIREGKEIVINPCLKEYEFYKVMDSYSAYQELDMWICGTLAYPQNFMIDIGDKYKVIEHGFDPKYGFRTRPK